MYRQQLEQASIYIIRKRTLTNLWKDLRKQRSISAMSSNNLDTLYRQVIMDHYKHPRNRGVIEDDSLTINMNNPTCEIGFNLLLKWKMKWSLMLSSKVKVVRFPCHLHR